MDKVLVYKDTEGSIRHVGLSICPIEAIESIGKDLKNFLVTNGAPVPASPIFALIRCK